MHTQTDGATDIQGGRQLRLFVCVLIRSKHSPAVGGDRFIGGMLCFIINDVDAQSRVR